MTCPMKIGWNQTRVEVRDQVGSKVVVQARDGEALDQEESRRDDEDENKWSNVRENSGDIYRIQ